MTIHPLDNEKPRSAEIIILNKARGKGRPKVRSDEQQRDIIVDKSIVLFLRSGFTAMRMDDVAAECGISKRTLYRLFPSKLDLFRSMVEQHRQSMLTFSPALHDMDLDDALISIFGVDIDPELDRRRIAFIQYTLNESRQIPELAEILREEGAERAKLLLAEWLSLRCRDESLKIEDPAAAASILMDMVFGAVALKSPTETMFPGGTDRKGYVRQCIHYFVHGVR